MSKDQSDIPVIDAAKVKNFIEIQDVIINKVKNVVNATALETKEMESYHILYKLIKPKELSKLSRDDLETVYRLSVMDVAINPDIESRDFSFRDPNSTMIYQEKLDKSAKANKPLTKEVMLGDIKAVLAKREKMRIDYPEMKELDAKEVALIIDRKAEAKFAGIDGRIKNLKTDLMTDKLIEDNLSEPQVKVVQDSTKNILSELSNSLKDAEKIVKNYTAQAVLAQTEEAQPERKDLTFFEKASAFFSKIKNAFSSSPKYTAPAEQTSSESKSVAERAVHDVGKSELGTIAPDPISVPKVGPVGLSK
jgi:hypothetical protein